MAVAIGSRSPHSLSFGAGNLLVTSSYALPNGSPFTVMVWFKLSSAGLSDAIVWASVTSSKMIAIDIEANSNKICYQNGNYAISTTLPAWTSDTNWHHLAVVDSFTSGTSVNTEVVIYIDGIVLTMSGSDSISPAAGNFCLGGRQQRSAGFQGLLDQLVIVESVVSSGDVNNVYLGLVDPLSLSPVVFWATTEGTGSTAYDSSGNGKDGALDGGISWSSDAPGYLQDWATSGYQTIQSSYSFYYRSSGANRNMQIGVSLLGTIGNVSSVTVNGTSATFKLESHTGAYRQEVWEMKAPNIPYGSPLSVAVTLSGSLDSVTNCVSLTGANSGEAYAGATALNVGAADATVTFSTITDNDYIIAFVCSSDATITVGTGQTEIENVSGTLGTGAMSYKGPIHPAGSDTEYWTNVGAAQTWAIIVVGVTPAGVIDALIAQICI